MSLQDYSELMFYSECDDSKPPPFLVEQFFVGLYREKSFKEIIRCETEFCVPWARWRYGSTVQPSPSFIGGALVQEMNKALLIRNIGTNIGYGPLLYACILHLARARRLDGVVPSRDPAKLLVKPKNIWRNFATNPVYSKIITCRPIPGTHSEDWLNQIFSINNGKELITFENMRSNTKHFWDFWRSKGIEPNGLSSGARAMAELSVQAHRRREQ